MKSFDTISEFRQYRKFCPICLNIIHYKHCSAVDNYLLTKAKYGGESFILKIAIKNKNITRSTINSDSYKPHNEPVVSSINPFVINCFCSTRTNPNHKIILQNEYFARISVDYDEKKSSINKINLISEVFIYYESYRFYSLNLLHDKEDAFVIEHNAYFKVLKTHTIKYTAVNVDKIYNKDYIKTKINNILLLQ